MKVDIFDSLTDYIELRCKMAGCIVNSHIIDGEIKFLEGIDGFKRHLELYHGMSVHDDDEVHKWCCFRKLSEDEAVQATEEYIKGTGKLCVDPA
jgi:hypothetical protein